MYGIWGADPRAADPVAPPFEIGMQGLGAFACRRFAWNGLNPRLRGFGGEEGFSAKCQPTLQAFEGWLKTHHGSISIMLLR